MHTLRFALAVFLTSLMTLGCLSTYDTEGQTFVEGDGDGDVSTTDQMPDITGPITCVDDYDCPPTMVCGTDKLCTACVPNSAPELCDGRDTNCNGEIDEGCDQDNDGYCDATRVVVASKGGEWPAVCPQGPGDCNDDNPNVHPGATEICDDLDNNCNDVIDEDCDKDGDGYCDFQKVVLQNVQTGNWPAVCPLGPGDCDDDDATVVRVTWYRDADADTYGDPNQSRQDTCVAPEGYVERAGDCNDDDANINPDATEICDDIDNDCNNQIDEGCDKDGDGYCDIAMDVVANATTGDWPAVCPLGPGDCDDTRADAYPGATEKCSGMLEDCLAAQADLGCNPDGDLYCTAEMEVVATGGTFPAVCPAGGGDCNEDRPDINPGASEICNNEDRNCDGNLPQLVNGVPNLIRGRVPTGANAEMVRATTNASESLQYGVVWQEESDERTVIRFARVTRNPSSTSGVSPITTVTQPGRAGQTPAIAWNPDTGHFGVAWRGPSDDGGWDLFFSVLNNNGAVVVPQVRVDAVTNNDNLRVVTAGNHFGIFYRNFDAGAWDFKYAPFNITTQSLGTPVRINLSGSRSVSAASFAILDETAILVWHESATQHYSGRINLASGTLTTSFNNRNYPSGFTSAANPRVFSLHGVPYMIFRNSGTLVAQRLTTSLTNTGPTISLVTDSHTSSSQYALSESASSGYALLYRPSSGNMKLARFDSTWTALSGSPYTTAFAFPSSNASQFNFYFHPSTTSFQYISRETTSGFFRFISLAGATGNTLTDVYPVSGATFTSLYASNTQALTFDHVSQNIEVIQGSPLDSNIWESYRIPASGVATNPTALPTKPTNCIAPHYHQGALRCYVLNASSSPCVTTFEIHALNGAQWTLHASATVPGDVISGSCYNGNFPAMPRATDNGAEAIFTSYDQNWVATIQHLSIKGVEDFNLQALQTIDANSSIDYAYTIPQGDHTVAAFTVTNWGERLGSGWIYSVDAMGELALPLTNLIPDIPLEWVNAFYVAATPTSAAIIMAGEYCCPWIVTHAFRRIDTQSGAMGPIQLSSDTDHYYSSAFLTSAGETFVYNLVHDYPSSPSTHDLIFIQPDHSQVTVPLATDNPWNIKAVTQEPDYVVIAQPNIKGIQISAYDTDANLITEDRITLESTSTSSITPFHTGEELRYFIQNNTRIFATSGTCH